MTRAAGDGFVVLLTGLRNAEAVSVVARKILATLGGAFLLEGHECRVSASIGICLSPEDGDDVDPLRSRADAVRYESEENGKNTFTCCPAARRAEVSDSPAGSYLIASIGESFAARRAG